MILPRTSLLLVVVTGLFGCGGDPSPGGARAAVPVVQSLELNDIPRGALTLPNDAQSIKFAVIGDSGRGSAEQKAIAAQMVAFQQLFDFRFVLMAGDNIYEGPATPEDYRRKFEEPYGTLLDQGVKFFAVLGNHDDPRQVNYEPFHMDGHRYYTFTPPVDLLTRISTRVRFFALDSTDLDFEQVGWVTRELARSTAEWKVVLLHYPLYSSGRYTLQARRQRFTLEQRFVDGGVDAVFSGHEHIYQRSELQNGILYFISGGAGSLRFGDAGLSPAIARSYDRDYHFMLIEITDDALAFQAINTKGETVDAGALRHVKTTSAPATADTPAPR
jgi:predicted phosphodiesterase